MEEELVSVIIPIYNVEKYLKKSVESVINQTYSNLEIILVDDGSTDLSYKLCEELKNEDTRIVVIHKENGGLSDARNKGIDIATGKYLFFLDSDDYIEKNTIEILYNTLKTDGTDMVIFNFIKIFDTGEIIQENTNINSHEIVDANVLLKRIVQDKYWRYVPAWNKLYKKEIWTSLRFPKGKLHEDEFVIHKVLDKCERISIIPNKLLYYVQRSGSIMNNISDKNRIHITMAFVERTNFYLEHGMEKQASKMFLNTIDRYIYKIDVSNVEKNNELKQEIKKIYKKINKKNIGLKSNIKVFLAIYFEKIFNFYYLLKSGGGNHI